MKIGIDLDGVVIDSETTFRTYEEIFDLDKLNGNNLIYREEPKFQERYNWKDESQKDAERLLNKYNIRIDKYYWKQDDKLEICLKEKVDLFIDDDYKIVEKLSNNNIKTLYFRDTGLK